MSGWRVESGSYMLPSAFREWCDRQGWSVKSTAHVLMVSHATIADWESGRAGIPWSRFFTIQSVDCIRAMDKDGTWDGSPMSMATAWVDLRKRMHDADRRPAKQGRPRKVCDVAA